MQETTPETNAETTIPRSLVFIEEIGKTRVDELANPAPAGQLAEVSPGDQLQLKVEGDHLARLRLDQSPMSARKLLIKSVKHGIWALVAAWTAITFVGEWDLDAWEAIRSEVGARVEEGQLDLYDPGPSEA